MARFCKRSSSIAFLCQRFVVLEPFHRAWPPGPSVHVGVSAHRRIERRGGGNLSATGIPGREIPPSWLGQGLTGWPLRKLGVSVAPAGQSLASHGTHGAPLRAAPMLRCRPLWSGETGERVRTDWLCWLDIAMQQLAFLPPRFRPFPADAIKTWPMSTFVISPRKQGRIESGRWSCWPASPVRIRKRSYDSPSKVTTIVASTLYIA